MLGPGRPPTDTGATLREGRAALAVPGAYLTGPSRTRGSDEEDRRGPGAQRLLVWRRGRRRRSRPEGAARREGRRARGDDPDRPARAARVHDLDAGLRALPPARRRPRRGRGGDLPGARAARAARGQEARRRRGPAAGLGALRGRGLDAGDDGHRAQPRAQRSDRRGARGAHRQPPLRAGQLPPLHHDVRQHRARGRAGRLRPRARAGEARARVDARRRAHRRGARARGGAGVPAGVPRAHRPRLSPGRPRAARARARRRLPQLAERARDLRTAASSTSRTRSAPR